MKHKRSTKGYALLAAILTVNLFIILSLKARSMWETEIQRDLEQELLFRARQYVSALEQYKAKNAGVSPQNLDELVEKKFLRQRYKDPMTKEGNWNVVMQEGQAGKKGLLIVPEELLGQYLSQAMLIGVCSTSPDEGFLEYRKKKRYNEWAVFIGEQIDKEMPELRYLDQPGSPAAEDTSKATESKDSAGSADTTEHSRSPETAPDSSEEEI